MYRVLLALLGSKRLSMTSLHISFHVPRILWGQVVWTCCRRAEPGRQRGEHTSEGRLRGSKEKGGRKTFIRDSDCVSHVQSAVQDFLLLLPLQVKGNRRKRSASPWSSISTLVQGTC